MRRPLLFHRLTMAIVVGVCVVAAVWTGANVRRAYSDARRPPTAAWKAVDDWRSYTKYGHWVGSPSAPVVIVAFVDYECPACQQLARRFTRLRRRNPASIALVVRDFPLGSTPTATMAAVAADCAAQQQHFESMYQVLLSPQDDDANRGWNEYAEASGIPDLRAFLRCLGRANPDGIVERDLQDARRLGVSVVPTLLVNDSAYQGLPWDFEAIVARQMKTRLP